MLAAEIYRWKIFCQRFRNFKNENTRRPTHAYALLAFPCIAGTYWPLQAWSNYADLFCVSISSSGSWQPELIGCVEVGGRHCTFLIKRIIQLSKSYRVAYKGEPREGEWGGRREQSILREKKLKLEIILKHAEEKTEEICTHAFFIVTRSVPAHTHTSSTRNNVIKYIREDAQQRKESSQFALVLIKYNKFVQTYARAAERQGWATSHR